MQFLRFGITVNNERLRQILKIACLIIQINSIIQRMSKYCGDDAFSLLPFYSSLRNSSPVRNLIIFQTQENRLGCSEEPPILPN